MEHQVKTFFIWLADQCIDAHGLKIQGRGYLMFFAKIPRGVKNFRRSCLGDPPISGFIAFLLRSVMKFACVHLWFSDTYISLVLSCSISVSILACP